MNSKAILKLEFVNNVEFEGFESYDYEYGAVETKASVSTVFELFNGVVTAIEDEANARGRYAVETYGELPYAEKRTLELVVNYDEFINRPDFELDIFSVGKLDIENFWAAVGRRNNISVGNKAVTYGKSTIYSVKRGKNIVGFLLNNMTYDGQNSWFLTSIKYGAAARYCFKGTGTYPRVIHKNGQPRNRWTRVLDELEANGGTTVNAWSILSSEDSRFFYAELKKHNGVDKAMRQQLKAVRRAAGGKTFICHVDELESVVRQLETARDVLEEKLSDNGANWTEAKREAVENGIRRLDGRIYDKNVELWDLTEEHNSESAVTTIDDY